VTKPKEKRPPRKSDALPAWNVNNRKFDAFVHTRSDAAPPTIPFPGHWLSPLTGITERKQK
jgi:hypothetical protein